MPCIEYSHYFNLVDANIYIFNFAIINFFLKLITSQLEHRINYVIGIMSIELLTTKIINRYCII